jgi:hypothetical protein
VTALGYHDDAGQWRTYSVPVLRPRPPEGLCWAAKEPRIFPTWHRSTARYRGGMFYTAEWPGVRLDPREPMRRSKLYDEHGPRSPLLRRDEWALEVRVYGPGRIRYNPPVFG